MQITKAACAFTPAAFACMEDREVSQPVGMVAFPSGCKITIPPKCESTMNPS